MAKLRRRHVWLVRWEWVGRHAAIDKPFVTAVPTSWSGERVRDLVERLYATLTYEPDEVIEYLAARGGRERNPYPARFDSIKVDFGSITQFIEYTGAITCGHNPMLVARQATVTVNDVGDVSWKDDPPLSISAQ